MTRVAALLTVVIVLAGCTAVPADAWRLAPIAYDNRMDGEGGPGRVIDVSYAMNVVSDTAGGLWGESGGSWLHLDADGETVRRFNLEADEARPVNGLAALTPERLLVSTTAEHASGSIQLFDTESGSWSPVASDQVLMGDLAVHDGVAYVVAFATGQGTFTVRRVDPAAPGSMSDATPPLPWPGAATSIPRSVAIDVGPDGVIYVATEAERIIVDAEGAVRERAPHESTSPAVAVGHDGTVVWSGGVRPSDDVPSHLDGGSAEARGALADQTACAEDHLVVGTGVGGTTLPFLCAPHGLAWVGEDTFVVSVGGEADGILVEVTLPVPAASSSAAAPR